ncbi:MAG: FAD-dependent oxidoreductase [Rhodobacter sp.]|nr:FAD-dependent oxidoreductase [Paracoccaceae bacterium]MCC0077097.1 FAD-dependent oxidoreductase [Rhodobacter sp.]
MKTDVLIVGAGPVGLSLALELAHHGVRSVVVEQRAKGGFMTVRCNHISSRSMEFFRRHGLADTIRQTGLPVDYPQDVSYRTATTGVELSRIKIAARGDRKTDRDTGVDAGWPTAEPPHRMNQIYLEPLMIDAAEARPEITLLFQHEMLEFTQNDAAVTARVRTDAGDEMSIQAQYLAGCDGGGSRVRKAIGAKLEGDAVIQRVQSTYLRAPGLIAAMQVPPCWCMFSMNPRRSGNIYSIDGKELWLVHNYLRDDEADFDSVDRDRCLRDIFGVGPDFEYEILNIEDWFGRRLVVDKLRDGRVFLAGDASHLWVPYAGYGMNAGIADAFDLGWILGAVISGWGGPALLDAYVAERGPITEQVSRFAMDHCMKMAAQRSAIPAAIEDATPEGEAARAHMGRETYDLNVQQYAAKGLNYGYFYENTPVILADGGVPPGYAMAEYTPSTVPGCRVPHFVLPDGRSLYDTFGTGYTLLRLDPRADVTGFVAAAEAVGMPLGVLDIAPEDPGVAALYTHPLVLVRPDQHVAWRGAAEGADPAAILDRLRGVR